jgi:hypothetical protein
MKPFASCTGKITILNSIVIMVFTIIVYNLSVESGENKMMTTILRYIAGAWNIDSNTLEISGPEGDALLKRFFPSWNFLRITDGALPPRVMYVATKDGRAEAVRLESGLSSQFVSDRPQIRSSADVEAITNTFLAMVWPTAEWVRSLEEIPGLSSDDMIRWGPIISEPQISREGNTFLVDGWLLDNGWVQKARFTILPSGISVKLGSKQPLGLAIELE